MRRFRLSIAGMMTVVLVLALGFAAISDPTPMMVSWAFSVAWCVLTVALIGGVFGRGRLRVFMGGFAIAGWAFAVANFAPWVDQSVGELLVTKALPPMIYQRLKHYPSVGNTVWIQLDRELIEGTVVGVRKQAAVTIYDIKESERPYEIRSFPCQYLRGVPPEVFERLCRSIFAMVVGLVGGLVATAFARGDRP